MFKKITILLVPFMMLTVSAVHGQRTKAFQQRKIVTHSKRFAVPTASVLIRRGTKPVKHANSTRFVNPNRKVNSKRLVPMKVYKYQKQGRRISVAELRKRLYALKNNKQSSARKTKPTEQNNPKLKAICDQYRALLKIIFDEMEDAYSSGRGKDGDELKMMYDVALGYARGHGCRVNYLSPKLKRPVIDKFKAKR